MQTLDWVIFIVYLIFVFLIGIWVTRKASTGINSYFSADKSIPWWWLGISIIATTFAADTPLAITGITANGGIVGNWFWWSWAATYITVAIFFAKRWRASNVLTDVEFIELRYDGKEAAFLRGFKAFFFGVIINCFILGWVITAAVKIAGPFIDWSEIAPNAYAAVANVYPAFLLFKNDLNATLTIVALLFIVLIYSSLGGIRGVILTDLFQFVIAIVTAILFAYLSVEYIGGLGSIKTELVSTYGAKHAENLTDFFPTFDNPLLPFQIFLIYVMIQWWVRYDSDGTGYIAQRINTAKNPEEAQKGSILFAIGFIAVRTWPWILVALVSLIVFPIVDPCTFSELGNNLEGDRESGYPMMMKLILPVGVLGLTFTSLMAAFMSTVDTHLNWGASYLANDIYKRFVKPKASEKELVSFSRWSVFAITILAILVSSQMSSIAGAWKFFINAASGLGIAQIMRWLWWRANAYTEISAMITAVFATIIATLLKSDTPNDHYDTYALAVIALISLVVAIVVTLSTKPVNNTKLDEFIAKCNPIGIWRSGSIANSKIAINGFLLSVVMWVLGITLSFSALFSIGYFLMLQYTIGFLLAALSIACFVILIKMINKENENSIIK